MSTPVHRADVVLREVRLGPDGPVVDVGVDRAAPGAGATVAWIAARGSTPAAGELVDGAGATLLRGLWDRHVHLRQCALRRGGVDLAGVGTVAEAHARLRSGAADAADVVFAFGATETLVHALADAAGPGAEAPVAPDRPVFVQALDLHTGWADRGAAARAGRTHPGLLRERDCFAVAAALTARADVEVGLRAVLRDAAARGVVGVLDFEMADNVADWPRRAARGRLPVRVDCSVPRARLDAAVAAGLRTGDLLDREGHLRVGPVKTFVDGSLGSGTALCCASYPGRDGERGRQEIEPAELAALIAHAGAHGLTAAVHAIGDRANQVALDAFASAGRGGRVEHAQLVRPGDLARFAGLGVVAGVQPAHLLDDRDLADRLWAGQSGVGYPYAALRRAGAMLEFGSDAPVSPLDPWLGVRAAVTRTSGGRAPWHPEQRLPLRAALDASTGGRATPRAGDVADLVLVEGDLLAGAGVSVIATMCDGEWTRSL